MVKRAKKRVVRKVAKKARRVILPKKLSSLIKICLRDMRKAEALPEKYVISMGEWYSPNETVSCQLDDGTLIKEHTVCVMCAAGSVMAFSLANERQKKETLGPDDFGDNELQLGAIDCLRQGQCAAAYRAINRDDDPESESYNWNDDITHQKLERLDTKIPDYEPTNPEPFHKAMTKLHDKLARAGL